MEKKLLTNIISRKYVAKVNKHIVEIGIKDEPKATIWLTEKQMSNLLLCFEQVPKGYSTKDVSVIGFWNEKGYYAYSKVIHHKKERYFKEPVQQDVSDLWEV
jgi:hypothetical protein